MTIMMMTIIMMTIMMMTTMIMLTIMMTIMMMTIMMMSTMLMLTMMMTTMSQIFTSQAQCRESSASWKRSSRWMNDLQAEDIDHFWDEAFDHCVDDFDHCGEDYDHYCDEDEDEVQIYDPYYSYLDLCIDLISPSKQQRNLVRLCTTKFSYTWSGSSL